MPTSFFLNNVKNLLRNLRQEPISALPRRLTAIARPKLFRLSEEAAYRSGFGPFVARAYRGKGIALMFHEIHPDVDAELRTGCSAAQLDRIIDAVRADGRDIVTIDEGLRRLAEPESAPFALLTFDDAYRDNRTNALPVLERAQAPMTLFVPTGMITRSIYAWWLGLREIIKTGDVLDLPAMSRSFKCEDLASKMSTMRTVTGWIGTDQTRADALAPVFAAKGIDIASLVGRYAMDEAELREFAAHPLVEIGAHTQSHRFLSGLDEAVVLEEFKANKAYLEELLGRPVRYLAYPYGTPGACGEREAHLAALAGYRASFTTRAGHLFAAHLEHPQLLPRIDVGYAPQSPAALASRLSGLHRAMSTRFGSPVAIRA